MTARILSADVARVVCGIWPVTLDELRGRVRQRRVAEARHAAMWLCCRYGNRSTTVLGRYFRRDHTTVLHGIRAVECGHWDRSPAFRGRLMAAEACVALLRPAHGPDFTFGWPMRMPAAAKFQSFEVLK